MSYMGWTTKQWNHVIKWYNDTHPDDPEPFDDDKANHDWNVKVKREWRKAGGPGCPVRPGSLVLA